ncbi:hypothetical protein AAL_07760 [Moelleriella libera RCEF 2490]|uniref:Uncharacterized protein n=1 Tax=Moelleriella libera RCEF 2490 TaxID=1081109 RepID=A0A167WZM1_9HYPO|nr:hypothetical protein AAL_07760 [Moelleriella libera RCEF 2490]
MFVSVAPLPPSPHRSRRARPPRVPLHRAVQKVDQLEHVGQGVELRALLFAQQAVLVGAHARPRHLLHVVQRQLVRQRRPAQAAHEHLDGFPRTRGVPGKQGGVGEQPACGHEARQSAAGGGAAAAAGSGVTGGTGGDAGCEGAGSGGGDAGVPLEQNGEGRRGDGRGGGRVPRARVDGDPVDVAVLRAAAAAAADDGVEKVDGAPGALVPKEREGPRKTKQVYSGSNVPQIIVHPDLDAHAPARIAVHVPLQPDRPPVARQPAPRLDHHVTHQLAAVHERRAQRLRARPPLRTPAVQVHAGHERRRQRGRPRKLHRDVGAELDNRRRLRLLLLCRRHGEVF